MTYSIGRKDLLIATSFLVIAILYYLTYYNYSLNMFDEGALVDSASRILHGQKMYRDFDHAYAPGRFYLLALLFKIFGEKFQVSRLMWTVIISLNVSLTYLLSSRLMPPKFAMVPTVMLLMVPASWYKSFYIFLPLLNMLVVSLYLEKKNIRWLTAFGFATSLSLILRQDVGLFTLAAGLFLLLIEAMAERTGNFLRTVAKSITIYISATIIFSLPVLFYFRDALTPMFYRVFIQPVSGEMKGLEIPFPSIIENISQGQLINWEMYQTILFYLPLVVYLVQLIYLAKRIIDKKFGKKDLLLLFILVLSLMLYNKVYWESQYDHLLQCITPSYFLGAYLVCELYNRIKEGGRRHSRNVAMASVAAFSVIPLSFLYYNVFICNGNGNGSIAAKRTMHELIATDNTRVYYSDPNIMKAIYHINEYTRPGDYLYVFPQSALFYFMTGRQNPTRQDFNILNFTDRSAELDIIKNLREKNVKFLIYDEVDTYLGIKRPERLYYKNYAKDAYRYIFDNYSVFDRAGRYGFMRKRIVRLGASG